MSLPQLLERIRALPLLARISNDAARHARVVQALPLGPGSRLLVVEFGNRRLLIGQARTGLVALAEMPAA